MIRIPRPTRSLRGVFAFAALLAGAVPAGAQTPTSTPTPTPTPGLAIDTYIPATTEWFGVANGGRYDAANLILDPDGSLWTASASENDVVKMSPDHRKATKWVFPTDAGPSSLLKDTDGTFWVTELGGFNIAHLDPATGALTRWADTARRPTSLVKAADGTFWLPETNGLLTHFEPATGKFTYIKTDTKTRSLSYPWLDADGSIWTCDFLTPYLMKFSPDGTSVTRWPLPAGSEPSKVYRDPDGKLWISLYLSGQIANFDEATNTLRTYQLPTYSLPFDMTAYRGRIVYSEQRYGQIGLLDPAAMKPRFVDTLAPETVTTTNTTNTVARTTSTITPADVDVTPAFASPLTGTKLPGVAAYPAGNGPAWGIAVDLAHARIFFSTFGNIGSLVPPVGNAAPDDQYLPAAASITGAGGVHWQTQVVAWNRGTTATPTPTPSVTPTPSPTPSVTPTPTPTARPIVAAGRLYPTEWIAGFSPAYVLNVPANVIVSQDDVIGETMQAPESSGSIRFSTLDSSQGPMSDLFLWGRVFWTRSDGGTYGFAQNAVKASRGVIAPQQEFFFAPEDVAQRTNAGFLVLQDAKGTVSVVDASGQVHGSFSFDWPSGYQWQGSTIFSALGIDPIPSARVVFSLTAGQILPFGISIDPVTNDPIGLDVFAPKSQASHQFFPAVSRGPFMGGSDRTDLQLYNPNGADVHVTLTFRSAAAFGAGPPGPARSAVVTLPALTPVTIDDVLLTPLGVDAGFGTLELGGDDSFFAFARVTSGAVDGGRFGYGMAGRGPEDALAPPNRGVFISATDSGWDVTSSDLVLVNAGDTQATVDLRLTDASGTSQGTQTVTVGAHETRVFPSVWYAIAGFGVPFGRIDVVPADGSPPLYPVLLRRDQKTRDTDPLVPFVIPQATSSS